MTDQEKSRAKALGAEIEATKDALPERRKGNSRLVVKDSKIVSEAPRKYSQAEVNQLLSAQREPMVCGHPKACWVDPPEAKSLSESRRFALQGGHCSVCQLVSASVAAAIESLQTVRTSHNDWCGFLVHKINEEEGILEFDQRCPECVIKRVLESVSSTPLNRLLAEARLEACKEMLNQVCELIEESFT